MCVMLGPKVVVYNAFGARNESNFLEVDELRQFCNLIYKKIKEKAKKDVRYKYVFFQMGTDALSGFCKEGNESFVKVGDRIYAGTKINDESLNQVNAIYDTTICGFLEEARKEFAGQVISGA